MDFYQPVLANGEKVRLPLILIGYKITLLWPLQERATFLQYLIRNSFITLTQTAFLITDFAHLIFIYENSKDIAAVSECLTTLLMGIQFFIMTVIMAIRESKMRHLFERFYKEIYFASQNDPILDKRFTRTIRFITIFTFSYLFPMMLKYSVFPFEVAAAGGLHSNTKPHFYRMSFPWYDAQDPVNFIITGIYTSWLQVTCSFLMAADDYLLCLILIHTSYRYKELQQELQAMLLVASRGAADEQNGEGVWKDFSHVQFRQRLHDIFRKQQRLDSFVQEAKLYFTYQIFFCLSFGVILLCVLFFHLLTISFGLFWLIYIIWLDSQTVEFIMIGHFGQMLLNETCALGDSYYMCHWELIMSDGDSHVTRCLLKDIRFAIMRAGRGIVFDGFKIFPLTHRTVGYALRSALSYFMFLSTVNEM